MAIRDSSLLTYLVGTDAEIEKFTGNIGSDNWLGKPFEVYWVWQGTLFTPLSLLACPPVGAFLGVDFFYRAGQSIFNNKYGGKHEPAGLIGKVREIHSKYHQKE